MACNHDFSSQLCTMVRVHPISEPRRTHTGELYDEYRCEECQSFTVHRQVTRPLASDTGTVWRVANEEQFAVALGRAKGGDVIELVADFTVDTPVQLAPQRGVTIRSVGGGA